MRKDNQEIKDPLIIEEILKLSRICRIGMADEGKPYILPFNYGYRNRTIYIHCAPEGKKIDIIKQSPEVCFEIEQTSDIIKNETACNWATLYRSVVGYGNIEIVHDFDEKLEGLNIIMAHNGGPDINKFEPKQVDAILILKLNIETITGKQSGNWEKISTSKTLNLETDRLLLEEISINDLNDIHQLHSIPVVDEFNTLGIPENIRDTEKILKTMIDAKYKNPRSSYNWKILLKSTNQFIGLAGFTLSNNKFKLGEIYYKLNPDHWGYGYATEIAKKLIKTGFEIFNLQKVEAGVATENIRSVRVLEKAGMTREGLRRKILPIRGEWKDNYHYAIVKDDDRDY